jgi:hypothetical protein
MAGSAPTLGLAVVFDAEEWRLRELFDERGELMRGLIRVLLLLLLGFVKFWWPILAVLQRREP